jgi:hypothetical protein
MRWETVVTLPTDRDAARMRLEVAEYELLRSDEEFGLGLPGVTYAACRADLTPPARPLTRRARPPPGRSRSRR